MTPTPPNPEERLLGAAMRFPSVIDNSTLDPADFSDLRYAAIWQLMHSMRDKNRDTDAPAVLAALTGIPANERRGIDAAHLFSIVEAAPNTALEGEHCVRDVANAAANRRLIGLGHRAVQLGEAAGDAIEAQDFIRNEVEHIARATSEDVTFVRDTIDDTLEGLDNPSPAIPTPWPGLNHFMRGWSPGSLYVVGARPGVGKSLVLLQAAAKIAERGNVLFHSLEMSEEELNARLISQRAEVPLGRLGGRTDNPDTHMTARDWERVAAHRDEINALDLAVDTRLAVTVADIRAKARAVIRTGPLFAIFVDYLQLIEPPRHMNSRSRAEIVGHFSRSLKAMAKEFHVPVIAAVQLNRQMTQRPDAAPTMADIRESGAVEQDSDVILLLHSADKFSPDLDLIVAKQRQGEEGVVELTREGHYARVTPRVWHPHQIPPPAYANN